MSVFRELRTESITYTVILNYTVLPTCYANIVYQVDRYSVAAHHFVLASSSEEFANMARKETVTTVKMQGVHIEILNQVLLFAYTRNCQMIQPGPFRLQ